jgi:HSP20 family protein
MSRMLLDRPAYTAHTPAWSPPVDVAETDDAVLVRVEIPGVDPEGLLVTVSRNGLVVAGEKRESDYDRPGAVVKLERRFGPFRRLIPLPPCADPNRVHTTCADGVLTVRFSKIPSSIRRRIPLSV